MPNENKLDPQALKERIGKHLRTADEFTRYQRYEEAILEIEAALKIDPKNNYARSFLERVKLMQKRSQQKETVESGPVEMSLEERMEIISRHLSTAEEFINKKDYKHALEEVARVYKIDPTNYYAQTYSERIDSLMLEETAEKSKPVRPEIQPESQLKYRSRHHLNEAAHLCTVNFSKRHGWMERYRKRKQRNLRQCASSLASLQKITNSLNMKLKLRHILRHCALLDTTISLQKWNKKHC